MERVGSNSGKDGFRTVSVASCHPEICCYSPKEQRKRSIWHFIPLVLMSRERDNKCLMTICDIAATVSHTWTCWNVLMKCWLSRSSALPTMNLCLRPIGVAITTQTQQYTIAVRWKLHISIVSNFPGNKRTSFPTVTTTTGIILRYFKVFASLSLNLRLYKETWGQGYF